MKLKRYFQVVQPGNIILVNTSSEEEAEERKTTLNRKFLARDTKIRYRVFMFFISFKIVLSSSFSMIYLHLAAGALGL